MNKTPPRWLTPLTDYGPLAVFFVAYLQADLMTATAALLGATVIALVLGYAIARHIPRMALVTAGLVGVFGGLTLFFQDDTFIKMKPTVVQLLFAVVLGGGLALGKSPLQFVMGKSLNLDPAVWKTLTIRYAIFFVAMAALNELVWRTQSESFWVSFKVFGLLGLTIGFSLLQIPFLGRHMQDEIENETET
ncbi:MAG: septation protein A [Verrucomicrobia bacterium]|nr:septation protein A [Verrucomicrobiota bacterium]